MSGLWLKATVFLVLATGNVFSAFTSTNTYEDKSCRYVVQVNEGNQVLFSETIEIPGWYGKTSCYETSYTGCLVNTSTDDYIKGMRKLGSHTFADSIGQICYLKGLAVNSAGLGCFTTTQYVYGLKYTIACEDSATVPAYCGKSESYTKQVLLARHEMECEALGGTFTGGVYPFTQADGSEEYCVSGSCTACDSDWRNNLMKNWKDSVCCEKRELEPNPNNGTCVEARSMDSTQIGVSYPKITAFPGCSGTKAGEGENYCNVEPSSSSSSSDTDQQTSSSSAEPVSSSSSEDQENANCYATDMDAKAALADADWQCKREGNTPSYSIDGQKCLTGNCKFGASSSSVYSSDSGDDGDGGNSSSSEDGQCLANSGPLLKTTEDNNGWVYVGKEVYGTKSVKQNQIKPNSTFFDALGKAYRKIKSQIRYFVRKSDIEKTERVYAVEFEIYKKVIQDDEGNDIEIFRKEDDKNGLRRDSTAFIDGSWEVMETDDINKIVKSSTVMEVQTVSKYNSTWHIEQFYLINKGDTITKELYVWNGGKLAKMTQNGFVRRYIYGNTLQDTVKVIPSDEGLYFHSGYNNSVGKIPNEDDPMYEYYAKDPYGGDYSSKSQVVKKMNAYQYPVIDYNFPAPTFINPHRESCNESICPKNHTTNGTTRFDLFLNKNKVDKLSSCVMYSNNCYGVDYEIRVDVVQFEILQSILKFNEMIKGYERWCRTQKELQDTYEHEKTHIKNAYDAAKNIVNTYMPKKHYNTETECKNEKLNAEKDIYRKFTLWLRYEAHHLNTNSPQYTGIKIGELCDVE